MMSKQYFMRYPQGLRKALTLSYDDGPGQDVRMMEILNRYGIKCTFNINSASFNGSDERCELYNAGGHEIAVHTVTHPRLDLLSSANVTYEVLQDRVNLEKMFGKIVRGMAYPFGPYNDTVIESLRSCGIVYSRTTVSTGRFDLPTDWLKLPTTCHHNDPRLFELANKFLSDDGKMPQMFYLWGHSHEFDSKQNWDVIENFAELMGNREDIWYATNIEIYDYVKAYENLHHSADGSLVYNSSACSVWIQARDGEPIEIGCGQFVTLE